MSTINLKSARPAKALLNIYLARLSEHPLQTKMISSGILSFLQEVLASHLANVKERKPEQRLTAPLQAPKIDSKAVKMGLYGAFVSAPMGHALIGLLQKAFAGRTSTLSRFCQILASNLFVAPVQAAVYLTSLAIINGVHDPEAIIKTVKSKIYAVLKISWSTSPLAIILAQRFIPPELWVPWFNLVTFLVGTYLNTRMKRLENHRK